MSGLMDQPNREVLGLEPMMSAGNSGAEPKTAKAEKKSLPGQHAGLDELAAERGHEWSSDDLTVAEKQAELESA
jgi:hypothetical protein